MVGCLRHDEALNVTRLRIVPERLAACFFLAKGPDCGTDKSWSVTDACLAAGDPITLLGF